jgi:PAS domain S-box-containing protein
MNDTITYWNRAAERLFGWPRDAAIGRKAGELLGTKYPAAQDAIRAELLRTGSWEGELVHSANGGARIVTASRWALQRDKAGRPRAVLDTNTDITAANAAQEALHRAQAQLAHAGRVATLGELSASIAHEVNQPLAAIVTNGEAALRWLARAQPDLGEAQDALKRVIKDGERASDVIRRIRSMTRKSGQSASILDLNGLIEESLALLQRELAGHRIALELDLTPRVPAVEADRIQLQQVVINLLMNAMQAMDAVAPEQRRLRIRTLVDPAGDARLEIEDSGSGFDAETETNLFAAFFTTKPTGMGMGLSICRSIVEASGGRISAARNAGPGATFSVTLPGKDKAV